MKTLLLSATLASIAFTFAAPVGAATKGSAITAFEQAHDGDFDKKKRKRGGKVRVQDGSGCDDPEDILEHPECRG